MPLGETEGLSRALHSPAARWAALARDTAKMLAPYQSATFKAIGVNVEMARRPVKDDEEPVRYPSVASIRRELALRGLPPLADIIDGETIDEED
jgi:hypothetical protein